MEITGSVVKPQKVFWLTSIQCACQEYFLEVGLSEPSNSLYFSLNHFQDVSRVVITLLCSVAASWHSSDVLPH